MSPASEEDGNGKEGKSEGALAWGPPMNPPGPPPSDHIETRTLLAFIFFWVGTDRRLGSDDVLVAKRMALRSMGLLRRVLSKSGLAVRVENVEMHATPQPLADPTDSEFDCKYEAYFNRGDIDGWEIRKGLSDLHGMDLIPDPKVINAALRACRRVNDYALAVRCLESVKFKCANNLNQIWPYILQEIKPTLDELGVDTPEELGYEKPELHTPSVYEPPPATKLSDEPKPEK